MPLRTCPRSTCVAALVVGLALPLGAEEPLNPLRAVVFPGVSRSEGQRWNVPPSQLLRTDLADSPAIWSAGQLTVPQPVPEAAGPEELERPDAGELAADPWADPVGTEMGEFYAEPSGHAWYHRLGYHWFREPWFSHSDPNDPERHVGLGQPLVGTSWRNRPLFVGAFVGGVILDDLISERIDQADTALVGLRLGWDFDHYWGLEGRWAFAQPELIDSTGDVLEHGRNYLVDVSLVHYPWGDARWRPYYSVGLGFQTFRFNDEQHRRISESLASVPLGLGVKYFGSPWFTLRFEVLDNIAIGNERVSGMHNFSLMTGMEFRFGGRRQSYFPWHNNTAYW